MSNFHFLKLFRLKSTISVITYVILFSTLMTRVVIFDRFLLFLVSNLLAVWAIFSYNDLEDAKYDMKFGPKRKNNPISSRSISKNIVPVVIFISSLSSILLALYINIYNFYLIVSILVIGFLYSSSYFRLKTKPPFDVIAHATIGALVSLSVFITLEPKLLYTILYITFFIGSAIPEILNQRYDYEIDGKTGIKTTVRMLGKNLSLKLVIILANLNLILHGIIFFLYGGVNLLIIYVLLSPLTIIFAKKKVRRFMERKPLIIIIPVFLMLLIALLGFFKIV